MKLSRLFPSWHGADISISSVELDSRRVAPGSLFLAVPGLTHDGRRFIDSAVAAGAAAVAYESGDGFHIDIEGVPCIPVTDLGGQLSALAGVFHDEPSQALGLIGVTGTNGKTSTVEMTRQIWRMCGFSAASIGTLGVTTPDESVSTGLTTPDIVTFLSNMTGLAREGVTHVAYEASSHGLLQFRNEGLKVAAGAFTNLSRDHLDYHDTMEDYFAAKMRLFDEVVADGGKAVIWADDPHSDAAIDHARRRGLSVLSIGNRAGEDGIRLNGRHPTELGQELALGFGGAEYKVRLPLIGAYQAANALMAAGLVLAAADASGPAAAQVFDAMSRLQPVRGRLERAAINRAGAPAYVDYAHTPEALEAAISALRPHVGADGRLIVVFGAGGDRDAGKRGPMGAIAAREADVAIVTDDNPRGEDPAHIRTAVMVGAEGASNVTEIAGRREAIAAAIRQAGKGDIVLIAGKGHEQGQVYGRGEATRVHPFDDVTVARECAA